MMAKHLIGMPYDALALLLLYAMSVRLLVSKDMLP